MKKPDSKQRLIEVMTRLDKTFKSKPEIIKETFEPDYSKGEYFYDKLEEIINQMQQAGYDNQAILSEVNKILGIEDDLGEGRLANLAAGVGMAAGTMFGGGAQAQTTAPINKPGMEQADYSLMNDYYVGIATKLAAEAKQKGDTQSEIAYNKIAQHYKGGNTSELSAGLKPYMDNIIKTQQSASHNDIVNYVRGVNESEVEEGRMANLAAGIGMAAGTMFGGGAQAQQMVSAAPMNKPGMEQTDNKVQDADVISAILGVNDMKLSNAVHAGDTATLAIHREIKEYFLNKRDGKEIKKLSPAAVEAAKKIGAEINKMSYDLYNQTTAYGKTVRSAN